MAGVSYTIALVGPWWSNTKDSWTVEMTLWKVHLNGKVNAADAEITKDLTWDEFCDQTQEYSVKDKEWCDTSMVKIKAARGTAIVATVFAWVTLLMLVLGWQTDNPQCLGCGAGLSALVSLVLAVSAIGIGVWYPNESALDDPEYGFVFLCVGVFFSTTAILIALFGCICSSFSTGFQSLDEGSKWGGWKPKRKEMPPPALPPPMMPMPMPRPVVAMPQPPPPAPVGRPGDFGIAPVGSAAAPNPMSPSMPKPSGADFGVDAMGDVGGQSHNAIGGDFGIGAAKSIPQPVLTAGNKGMAQSRSPASYGKDFGLDRE